MRKNKQQGKWTDETVMPWGKYKGAKLKDIEASYWLWMMEQPWLKDWPQLAAYLKENADALYQEKADEEEDDGHPFSTYQDFLDNH